MDSFRIKLLLAGIAWVMITLVTAGSVLAHPHGKGINPFEKKHDVVSLHCLLKQHQNHLGKYCPHRNGGKVVVPSLYSGCGNSSSKEAIPVTQVKNQTTPILLDPVVNPPVFSSTRILQTDSSLAAPVFKRTTPPPRITL